MITFFETQTLQHVILNICGKSALIRAGKSDRQEKAPFGIVDCLTQLICTWIFICSMPKLKEHSRESATIGNASFSQGKLVEQWQYS